MDSAERIAANLARLKERIAEATRRSGRTADAVRLVAVTKSVGSEAARALMTAGCVDLGESRPQDLWQKAALLTGEPIRWHLVGHLQRNKVRRTLPLVALIHSLDSLRLAAEIDAAARAEGRRVPVLLEVNVSGEEAKHGFPPADIEPALPELAKFSGLEVRGLMTMAALEGGRDAARRDFAALCQMRDRLRTVCPEQCSLDELSMGMSGDFDVAIEEGATIVRVGSALFEGVA